MKTKSFWFSAVSLVVAWLTPLQAAEPASAAPVVERIGVYDSRAVAYAHFWSADEQRRRDTVIAEGRAAKAAGKDAIFEEKSRLMSDYQKRMHEEVFSDAPAAEAMAALAGRMPALLGEWGVARLVSQWDTKSLQTVPASSRVDVTEKLIRVFITPDEKQRKVLDSMKTTKPLPRGRLGRSAGFGGGWDWVSRSRQKPPASAALPPERCTPGSPDRRRNLFRT
ncbi:MAG: hypothetical protein JNN01_20445 [Opitutaceae bacterium]|nr:hypothetical protein [Opitutaceae bacterium]